MMVTQQPYTLLSETQSRVLADARRHFRSYQAAQRNVDQFPGWMFWKKYPSGRTYLVHAYDRTGKGTTLGAESAENEAKLLAFRSQQADAKLRLKLAKDKVTEQARFCKAARINRVPRFVAAIVRGFTAEAPALQSFVIDSYAIYVYEAFYGVQFSSVALNPPQLTLALYSSVAKPHAHENANRDDALAATRILRSIDDTFTGPDQMITNDKGFTVKILRAVNTEAKTRSNAINGGVSILHTGMTPPATLAEVVIDQDGLPFEMRAPDPRLFAANKRLLSMQESRSAEEREHDRLQSDSVAALIRRGDLALRHLPKLPDIPESAKLGAILCELGFAGE